MKIEEYRQWLERQIAAALITAPKDTTLGEAGETACLMVRAYVNDGTRFLKKGDVVNGVACFGYAEGWLDAARALGLIGKGSPVLAESLELQEEEKKRFIEKTYRYHRLLQEGLSALEPAPEKESIFWKGACRVLEEARFALERGEETIHSSENAEALRQFSYGHGWLDAGVRCGIFRITGDRDLFTI